MAITDDEDLIDGFSGDGNPVLVSEKSALVIETTVLVSDFTRPPETGNVMDAIVIETEFSALKPALETETIRENDPTIDVLTGILSYQAIVALLGVSLEI